MRDNYAIGDDRMLIVASDRLSAFDVVLPTGIPDKGAVLTQLSAFWFEKTGDIVPNHFIQVVESTQVEGIPVELPRDMTSCRLCLPGPSFGVAEAKTSVPSAEDVKLTGVPVETPSTKSSSEPGALVPERAAS